MRERPILFSGPMVLEILAGRKTQTRRPVKPPPGPASLSPFHHSIEVATGRQVWGFRDGTGQATEDDRICPYGAPGDRLWVRETWQQVSPTPMRDWPGIGDRTHGPSRWNPSCAIIWRADGEMPGRERWRPGIHMPRWASRLTLEVEAVRVERVQAISEEDARAEGMETFRAMPPAYATCRETLLRRWDGMYGGDEFAAGRNPWVWVVTFRRVTPDTGSEEGA